MKQWYDLYVLLCFCVPVSLFASRKQWRDNLAHLPHPLEQIGRRFTDDMFTLIFVNEKFCVLIKVALKFLPKGSVGKKPRNGYGIIR